MKANVNGKHIYDKQTKTWFEVTPEQYLQVPEGGDDMHGTNKRNP